MKITDFILKWNVHLSSETKILYERADELMKQSKDPAHDEKHIQALLSNIDLILNTEKNLADTVDFEVLILGICWHDCWRARVIPKNVAELFFTFWWDGLGSMYLFEKEAKQMHLSPKKIEATKYVIRKHHSVQFLPRTTIEAKMLKDADELEVWTLSRAKTMYKYALTYMNGRGMHRLMRRYLKLKIRSSIKSVYFQATAELLTRKMQIFLKEFDDEIATL